MLEAKLKMSRSDGLRTRTIGQLAGTGWAMSMFPRWRWHCSATNGRFMGADFSSQAIVLAVLMGGVAVVFWQQLVGAAIFIGESDA